MRFLIIDDNSADRELIKRKLLKDFDKVEFIEFGGSGTDSTIDELIARGGYDIVLTDYHLNWTDGLSILQKVKARYPDIPVVMCTGTGSEEIAVEGMKSGLSNYVLKKHLDHLPFAVQESLEKARLRKKYEEAIQQLRISEERYREVFEQGLTGIFIASADGKLLACNSAFAQIFGFASIDDAVQHQLSELFPDKQASVSFLELLKREKRLENFETEMRKQDGSYLYAIANVVGNYDTNSNLIEIKGFLFDNSERKKLEDQFLHAQKMESLGQLVSGIAHDFNNMLGGILGHTERSLSKITSDHPLYSNIKHAHELAERAARMTRQLLAFSRRQVLEPKDIDVNQVIGELLDFIGKILADRIEFIFKPDQSLKAIHADPTQIEQVLMNLCINARDAMPEGGTLTIKTHNVKPDSKFYHAHAGAKPADYICISVSDTGIGMDETVQKHLFEPFFTTKELGKGTGLGLAVVHGIVGQHNGVIDVHSKVGQGTSFYIYLPAVDRVPVAVPFGAEVKKFETAQMNGHSKTILLVEDDPDLRTLMSEILQEYGYIVMSACDGEEGLRLFQQHMQDIALVVADVVTPKMKGNELHRHIRALKAETRFLFVSGYQADEISHNFVLDSGLSFLPKPFDLDELATKVQKVLEENPASAQTAS